MNLELAILNVLECIHPRMERLDVIVAEVKNSSVKTPTTLDVERALDKLQDAGEVLGVSDKDVKSRWKATADGIVRLAESKR